MRLGLVRIKAVVQRISTSQSLDTILTVSDFQNTRRGNDSRYRT